MDAKLFRKLLINDPSFRSFDSRRDVPRFYALLSETSFGRLSISSVSSKCHGGNLPFSRTTNFIVSEKYRSEFFEEKVQAMPLGCDVILHAVEKKENRTAHSCANPKQSFNHSLYSATCCFHG